MNQQYINVICNLFSLSLNQLLFSYRVYPLDCFSQRSAVGLNLNSVKKSILSDYIDKLIEQLSKMITILEGIEISILSGEKVLTTFTINIVFKEEQTLQFSQFDSDIQLKSILFSLIQKLKYIKVDDQPKTFNVYFLSNGYETQNKDVQETIIRNWIPIQESNSRETKLINSLHMPNLDILVGMI